MKITVITPTWNQAEFIEHTIQSVVNQTYQDIEYIIVDNCSDDGTEEIVRRYMEQYSFIVYVREKDYGQADAINKGLDRATGDVVCWINSDDFYYSDTVFERIVEEYKQNTTTQVIAGDGIYCDRDGVFTEPILCNRKVPSWVLSRWYYILQPAVFWKRQDSLRLDTKYHYVFDWKYFVELQQLVGDFTYLEECFSVYRMYEDNKTGLDNAKRKKEIYLMQKDINVSAWNTAWCFLVFKGYEIAEKKNKMWIKNVLGVVSRLLFHITNKRICSF